MVITTHLLEKYLRICSIFFLLLPFHTSVSGQSRKGANKSWTVTKPFQRDVFIENKGQFSEEEKNAVGSPILYFTHKGSLYLYFTPSGLIFRNDSIYQTKSDKIADKDDGDKDEMRNLQVKHLFTKMQWLGCDPAASIEVENETPDYFTFPNGEDKTGKSGIRAQAWTKLIYKNIYKGIDVEFYYPEKGGIEYNIIVHPGADPSLVSILYSGSSVALSGKDMKINTGWGEITDHAPSAKDADGNSISTAFAINGSTVSFITGKYNKSKTLVIDPWMQATALGATNHAYDLGYDYQGNVYIYGGGVTSFYELQKYNSVGTLLWTFINTNFTYWHWVGYDYGGMTVDHKTGTSYMCEGYNTTTGCNVVKVNSNGLQGALFTGGVIQEMWKIGYDECSNQLVIATGGYATAQAALLDTNCTTLQPVNALGLALPQDQVLVGFDNAGQCYMATGQRVSGPSPDSNFLFKMPLPSLTPKTYGVPDHHNFVEVSNVSYYPVWNTAPTLRIGFGFNGLAANSKFVITYDGGKMRKWNAAAGTVEDSAIVSGTSYAWGGLDLDCAGNIYCGNYKSVSVYDSAMHPLGNIPLVDTVYAVLESPGGNIYACGTGFVSSVANNVFTPTPDSLYITKSNVCTPCSGTATAILNGCSSSSAHLSYLWSNGKTTQTISGLCPGTYSVTVTLGCLLSYKDSVHIIADSTINVVIAPSSDTICQGSSIGLLVTGIGGTYSWAPPAGLSCTNCINPVASPTVTTEYTVTVTNPCGSATGSCTVFVNPAPVTSFFADITQGCAPLCVQFRNRSTISSGRIIQWNWTFGNGDSSHSEDPIYCYKDTGKYMASLTATSDKGCSTTLEVSKMITVFSKPVANFIYSPQPVTILDPVVQFTDETKDANGIAYWLWNFGDGCAPDAENRLRNPGHTYQDTGMYCPQLVVIDNKGCTDTITSCLDVEPIFTLYIPSAFSPNGDDVNDIFSAKGTYVKSFEMYIFDRWGMELYHTTDINKGWNGIVKGGHVICQEDSYVYVITATDWSNKKYFYRGEFTLLK